MILALTNPQDLHAFCVQEGLRAKGHDCLLWFTADLAQLEAASIEIDEEGIRWSVEGTEIHLVRTALDAIWFRRPEKPRTSDVIHSCDRLYAEREYDEFFHWLLRILPADVFQVNPPEGARRARSKSDQQKAALRAGLRIPPTLYSNDPERIRAFVKAHGGRAVYKAFLQQGYWKLDENDGWAVLYTALMNEESLSDDEVLKATPGIYQKWLPKAYELRITVIGKYVFAAKLDSQATDDGQLDWRGAVDQVPIEPTEIPAKLTRAILDLMDELGLVFGALDFIVTPEGEYYFLEVNEMGQFLFVELVTGLPLLDAFCELLLQRRADFAWDESCASVRMTDFRSRVEARMDEAQKLHVEPRPLVLGEETDEQENRDISVDRDVPKL